MRTDANKGWVARLLNGGGPVVGVNPAQYDPEAVANTLRTVGPFFGPWRYFRLEVAGIEAVPPAPVLLVSNHSGGTSIPDVWGLLVAWYRHFGVHRPVHPMAHEIIMAAPSVGRFFARHGVLRGDRNLALATLRDFEHDVLVMPGGELDTWRTYRERYQVQFGNRVGYAKLALRAGVPIVPVAHAGAHETLIVLTSGRQVAQALGLHRIARAGIFPIHLSLPWGLTIGPWPHLPTPVTLRYRFGEPIAPAHGPIAEPAEDEVQALDERVRGAMQRLLDTLSGARSRRQPEGPPASPPRPIPRTR